MAHALMKMILPHIAQILLVWGPLEAMLQGQGPLLSVDYTSAKVKFKKLG